MVALSPLSGRARPSVAREVRIKRAFDVVVGTALCLIALPFVIVLALGVAVSLRAWPFFVQRRPSWQGRTLTIVKLRTLPSWTPRYLHKEHVDFRSLEIPPLCRLLRRTHLDELPQLASVVLGHMSLVGPRPSLPSAAEEIPADFDELRRQVRPGCTGLWQISVASDGALASAPRFDRFYLYNASFRLDVWTVIRTVGWVLHIAKPIELSDIPTWVLGPGLVEDAAAVYAQGPSPAIENEAYAFVVFDDDLVEVSD